MLPLATTCTGSSERGLGDKVVFMRARATKKVRSAEKPRSGVPAVGSKVRFVFGLGEVVGTVIEDRGDLGVGGRRLLRVRFELEGAAEPFETEIEAEAVRVAA